MYVYGKEKHMEDEVYDAALSTNNHQPVEDDSINKLLLVAGKYLKKRLDL